MPLVRASKYVASVDAISVDWLLDNHIRCVLLDRDNTLVPRDTKTPPPSVVDWLDRVRKAGIVTCMVSNNFHTSAVCASAKELDCMVVHHALKPLPVSVHRALRMAGVSREQAVMVGDQLFTDMMAGNLAGVRTVLVRPQSRQDLWFARPMRLLEKRLLRDVTFEGA